MIAASHPLEWHLHLLWLVAFPALVAAYLWATRRDGFEASGRQRLLFCTGVVVLIAAVTWPLGDLATHWLLLALVLQRLLLTLAVPPLLVLGTPRPLLARLTRPAPVDAALRVVVRPLPAVLIVTAAMRTTTPVQNSRRWRPVASNPSRRVAQMYVASSAGNARSQSRCRCHSSG